MGTEIQIKELTFAEDSLYKTQRVKVGGKSFLTPSKAMDIKRYIPGVGINQAARGINEAYKTFTAERIKHAQTTSREQEINREITRLITKHATEDDTNLCFVQFDENRLPNKDEIEFLTNLSYVHSDMTPLPLIPRFLKDVKQDGLKRFEEYNHFVKEAIDCINVLNHKPIMGVIPLAISTLFIPELLKTYIKEGITALCLDFQGSTVNGSVTTIRRLVKELKQQKMLNSSFIYSFNLGSGKLPKSKEVVPAKDILSFGFGFDTIGGMHVQKRLDPETRARIISAQNIFENSLRLFNKEDYGYYRATKKETVDKIYPKDSRIPLADLEKIKVHRNMDKLFNQEQQGLEAVNLRQVIREEHELLKYLGKKQYVEGNDIKTLGNVKNK
ncbi:MAG: hypothetical protein QME12_03970 [Nanoarchaeota archaeon]|nr:hypothetical protein [Nanoarchaeota archaeon]